jgi:hypothetical protein
LPGARSWQRFRASWLLPLLFVLSLPVVTTRLYASDEIEFFAWLRSWTFDRDVSFENEYRYFYEAGVAHDPLFHETFLERTNAKGLRENFAPTGTAILWAPFYAVGHVVALVTGAPADGFSRPYIAAVTYGSAVYGFLALLLTLSIIRRVVPASILPAVAAWIGTPVLFYSYIAPGFSHACSAFAVSLFLWIWLRVRTRWSLAGVVALGLAGALLAMVRDQDVLFVAGPALDFLRQLRGPGPLTVARGRVWVVGLVAAAAFIVGYLPQAYAYGALNGHAGPTDVMTRKMTWTSPHFFGVLLSPEHGFFFWTPLAFVAIGGLVWLAIGRRGLATADTRWLGRLALVMFFLQVYITGSVESWTVAGAFGQRRFVAVTPLLALGLAALAHRVSEGPRSLRALLTVVVAACLWWNLGLMALFGLNRMDRQRLSLRDNAWGVFVEVPSEAPSIVYRYLTDRASFYRAPRQ